MEFQNSKLPYLFKFNINIVLMNINSEVFLIDIMVLKKMGQF